MLKNKVERMLKLKELELPVPNFEVVKNPEEIKWVDEKEEYCGWCLRCSLEEGRDFSLPYSWEKNKEGIKRKILELKKEHGDKLNFIIYALWKVEISGNLMILKDKIIVEATKGMWDNIKSPDVHYSFIKKERGLPFLEKVSGDERLLSYEKMLILLEIVRKTKMENVLFEWSFDDREKLHVYDMIPVKK